MCSMIRSALVCLSCVVSFASLEANEESSESGPESRGAITGGPLRVHSDHPRYFASAGGEGGASPAPGDERSRDVLFTCDFEDDDWRDGWTSSRNDGRCETIASDPERGFEPLRGKALRIRVDKGGHYGASLLYEFREETGEEPEEIYFRYYLRFASDWDPRRGGKLPGISGTYGRAGWGGRPADGRTAGPRAGSSRDRRTAGRRSATTATTRT